MGFYAIGDLAWAANSITTTAGDFIVDGFAPGDKIRVLGAAEAANNGIKTITTVAQKVLGITETLTVDPADANAVCIAAAGAFYSTTYYGSTLREIFRNSILVIYSGTQPANADTATPSTAPLCIFTNTGGIWQTANWYDNGLNFLAAASGAISKDAGVWQETAANNSGTASWFRLYGNLVDEVAVASATPAITPAASTVLPRIDGSVGTSGMDLNLTSTTIVAGSTYAITTFALTMPYYYGA